MSVTMRDIALRVGVSQQAVSAAFRPSGTAKVSDEVREKIIAVARELNYTPNSAAQRLKGMATKTIGVYGVPFVSVLHQALFLDISLVLDRHGYNMVSCYGVSEESERRAVSTLLAKGVDGLIVTTPDNPLAGRSPVPHVFCPPLLSPGFDVAVDREAGSVEAAERLVEAGCRRPAFVTTNRREIERRTGNAEKFHGVSRVLAAHGLASGDAALVCLDEMPAVGREFVARLRARGIDALLASNDHLAGKLLGLLMRQGVRVPEDIKVVGFDGLALCDLFPVPLATVVQPNRRLAEIAVELLLTRIEAGDREAPPAGVRLAAYFRPAASSGEPAPARELLHTVDTYMTLEQDAAMNPGPSPTTAEAVLA